MFTTVLGHYKDNLITCPNKPAVRAAPYRNISLQVEDQIGFYLLTPSFNMPDVYVIRNYVLIDEELYKELTEN